MVKGEVGKLERGKGNLDDESQKPAFMFRASILLIQIVSLRPGLLELLVERCKKRKGRGDRGKAIKYIKGKTLLAIQTQMASTNVVLATN